MKKIRTLPLLMQPLRWRTPLITLLSSPLISIAHADYAAEILSENPIAYYRFDDGVAQDGLPSMPAINLGSAGAVVDGAYGAETSAGVAGALNASTDTAARGTGTLVSIPHDPSLNNAGSFSVETWLKPAAILANATLKSPIASFRGNDGTFGRAGWLIYQGDAANGFVFRTYNRNGSETAVNINSGAGITAGAWHHVVVTWDNAAAVGRIYVDGVLKNTSAPVAPGGPNMLAYEPNNTRPLTLGSRDGDFAWSGDIDETAYYNSVLSDAQVLAHYNNGISTSPALSYESLVLGDSPVGYWRLGEAAFGRTPPVADNAGSLGDSADGAYSAGSKNTGTGPSPASGFQGFSDGNSCLSLATGNGHVGTPLSLLNNRTAFTVMGWVKRGAIHSATGGFFGQNNLLEFGVANNGNSILARVVASGANLTSPYSFNDDEWGFVVLTCDATNSTLYLDGKQALQISGNITNYGSSAFNFNIGGGGIYNDTGDYFQGEFDEVAILDKALTAGRVQQLYDAAVGSIVPGLVNTTPTITPTEGAVPEGQAFSLSVDGTGTPPLTYEWFVDGVAVPDSNVRTLTVAASELNDPVTAPYSYTVRVTNSSGSFTSDPVQVSVIPLLRWTGTDSTNPSDWSISGNPLNWQSIAGGTPLAYFDESAVLFDDSGTTTTVTLTETVNPANLTFENSTKNYLINGSFDIEVENRVVKNGSGNVDIETADFVVYDIEVNDGIFKLGDTLTLGLIPDCIVRVNGGTFDIALPTEADSPNDVRVASGATVSISGSGNVEMNSNEASITGAGNLIFNRDGIVTVNQPNTVGGTVTIASGTVAFDGNQSLDRLTNGSTVTVAPGARMEIRGVNALPTGPNSVSVTLNQSTLTVLSGESTGTGANGESHAHLRNLVLDAATVNLAFSGAGSAYRDESLRFHGGISTTGNAPSMITIDSSANAGNSGIALSGVAPHIFDVASGADLIIAAEIQNRDTNAASAALTLISKTGNGVLKLADNLSHGYSGAIRVGEGTLEATGSVAGRLEIVSGASLVIGPSIGTFTAGQTILGGTFRCDIDGAVSDQLRVNGDLVFSEGSSLFLNVGSNGTTSPYYVIAKSTGTITGDLPALTGTVPPGYTLQVKSGSNLVLTQGMIDTRITFSTVPPSGTEDFASSRGGFTVSAPISTETDWTYRDGAWLSFGTNASTGMNVNTTYLTTPIYTVDTAGPVTISFDHRYKFEPEFDAGALEISVNGGAFTELPPTAFTSNGYNGTLGTETTSALTGKNCFLRTSSGHPAFITSTATLLANAPVDTTVQVRFMAAYDANISAGGWEIDSFAITGALPRLLKFEWPFGIVEYSDTLLPDSWVEFAKESPLLIDTRAASARFYRLKP